VKKLSGMGVPEGMIKIDGPKVATKAAPSRRASCEFLGGVIRRSTAQVDADEDEPGVVRLMVTLRAEWPLKARMPSRCCGCG